MIDFRTNCTFSDTNKYYFVYIYRAVQLKLSNKLFSRLLVSLLSNKEPKCQSFNFENFPYRPILRRSILKNSTSSEFLDVHNKMIPKNPYLIDIIRVLELITLASASMVYFLSFVPVLKWFIAQNQCDKREFGYSFYRDEIFKNSVLLNPKWYAYYPIRFILEHISILGAILQFKFFQWNFHTLRKSWTIA